MSNDNRTLRLTRPMMHGPAVKRLQELTDLLEIDLGPNDGIFGPDTEAEVLAFQRQYKLKADGVCGPATWAAIRTAVDGQHSFHTVSGLVDIRDKHPHPKLYKCRRTPDTVTGVTIHQTGCAMPRSAMGWRRLNAHIGITKEGLVILANDPIDWIWHAQGLSRTTIGVEIEGNFPGLKGNMRTLWKGGGGPDTLTPAQLTAADVAAEWIANWFRSNGNRDCEYIHAHRQSAKSRIADPGEEIWEEIGERWKRLLLSPVDGGPNFFRGGGRPLPREWNGDERYPRYWSTGAAL